MKILPTLTLIYLSLFYWTWCNAATHRVALTFDDLPSTGDPPPGMSSLDIARSILTTLKKGHVPPTYGFVNAGTLTDSPDEVAVLKAWRASGNLLGNHTFSHPDLDAITIADYEMDIAADEPVLEKFMGGKDRKDWHWFRYPFLSEGNTMEKRTAIRDYLAQRGYRVAEVTFDFGDYAWNDPYARCLAVHNRPAIAWLKATYLERAEASLEAGKQAARLAYGRDISHVMLLHIGGIETVMLPRLLELLRRKHFQIVTLKQAQSDPAYSIDPFGADSGPALADGMTLPQQMMVAHHLSGGLSSSNISPQLDALCR
jgi:peptidoglycan/xylan/chitin deacetylase (PgdA/CDA1 family)